MGHDHDHAHFNSEMAERALWVAFLLNLAFLVIEVGIGLWTNSLALLSDAGHMVSDVAALAIALVAQRLARARPGSGYTFGLKRVPVLGAFGNALALVAIAALILWEAWRRVEHPQEVLAWPVLIAGVAGLLVNVVSAWWLHRSGGGSLNIRGAFIHLVADALGSLGAIVAAVVLMTTGWIYIDALVSALIAGLILLATWPLLRDSTRVLLQRAPKGIDMEGVKKVLCSPEPVQGAHHVHIWEIDAGWVILTAILVTDLHELAPLERLADELRGKLHDDFGIEHATFEWRTCESENIECRL
jgi:cobalt-zinc-cadmium efflux system protein